MCSSGLLLCGGIHRDLFTVIYMCACVCVVCAFVEEGKILVYICLLCLFIVYSKVRVEGDGIFVRAETSKLAQFRQTMVMGKRQSTEDPRTFLIIGGGMNSQSHLTNSCHGTQLPPASKHDLAVTSLASRVQSSV